MTNMLAAKFHVEVDYKSLLDGIFNWGIICIVTVGAALGGYSQTHKKGPTSDSIDVNFVGTPATSYTDPQSFSSVKEKVLYLAGPENTLNLFKAEFHARAGTQIKTIPQEDYDWANTEVFLNTLPPRHKISVTDTVGEVTLIFGPSVQPQVAPRPLTCIYAPEHTTAEHARFLLHVRPAAFNNLREVPPGTYGSGRTLVKFLTYTHHFRDLMGTTGLAVINSRFL